MKQFLAVSALLLIIPLAGCATESGSNTKASVATTHTENAIYGSVKAPDRTPRTDVEIRLLPADWTEAKLPISAVLSRPAAAKTDADGMFELPGITPGSYVLFASRPAVRGIVPHFTAPVTVPFKGRDGIQAIF